QCLSFVFRARLRFWCRSRSSRAELTRSHPLSLVGYRKGLNQGSTSFSSFNFLLVRDLAIANISMMRALLWRYATNFYSRAYRGNFFIASAMSLSVGAP